MALNLLRVRGSLLTPVYLSGNLRNTTIHYADDSTKKDDLYGTLGISSSASQNEIKKAYYDLTLKYHPDRNENCDIAANKFRKVTEAYEVLSHFGLRKKYDQGIPLPLVKKGAKRIPIEHTAQYQKFFDSRVAPTTSNDRNEEIKNLSGQTETNFEKELQKREQSVANKTDLRALQAVLTIFLVVIAVIRMI